MIHGKRIGGRDRVEPEVTEGRIIRGKRIRGRDRVEPEVTKGRIIRGKRIGGRNRVEPEVIEGEIIFYVDHVCMLRLYFICLLYTSPSPRDS